MVTEAKPGKVFVTPNRENVPPHPVDGALPADGAYWTADQYTFRLIRDGDVTEVPPDGSTDPQRAREPEHPAPEPHEGDDPPAKRKQ
jgi:hypothetical protein